MFETGVASFEDLYNKMPSDDRLKQRSAAIIECFQKIPCNPCVYACPKGAIKIEGGINNIPTIDFNICNGCTLCIYQCPGLAIFVIGYTEDGKGKISLPYEFSPIPNEGQIVDALDRGGQFVSKAKVLKVNKSLHTDKTFVVTISCKPEDIKNIRSIKLGRFK